MRSASAELRVCDNGRCQSSGDVNEFCGSSPRSYMRGLVTPLWVVCPRSDDEFGAEGPFAMSQL